MKTVLFIPICLICFLSLHATSGNAKKYRSSSYLQILGKVTNANYGTDDECVVELIHSDKVIESVLLKKGKKKFSFILYENTNYKIRISRKGYISKELSINTQIHEDNMHFGLYRFIFKVHLMKESSRKRLNSKIVDLPVAIVHYNSGKDGFSYDKEYTAYIKKELRKPKSNQGQNTNIQTPTELTSNGNKPVPK